jgi:two-component system, OmpR family, sensor histidine kinase KdpD
MQPETRLQFLYDPPITLFPEMSVALNLARLSVRIAASALMVGVITWLAFALHAKAFTVGFLYLLLVLPIAFKWGFAEATVASVLASACLDLFFIKPLFSLNMSDPQDWIALVAFETVVLTVSYLAAKLRHQAAETAAQQETVDRLYKMSRKLLLANRGEPVGLHLTRLIVEVFGAAGVTLWNFAEEKLYQTGAKLIRDEEVYRACLTSVCEDDCLQGNYIRPPSHGPRKLGALGLAGGTGLIDGRAADAIASLTVIALERERAFFAESTAEASRQSEKLRSAVLDGLAHAYKTPLAIIQTASSGLLEINRLDDVEKELANTIQIEVQYLADLTSQSLRTARLETELLKLQPERILLRSFLQTDWSPFVQGLERHSLEVDTPEAGGTVWADPKLLKMALAQLLDNASRYSEPGTPIRLGASVTTVEMLLSIHNYGSYIPPGERDRIFKRFYRSPNSSTRTSGTGIGLTVSRQIAEAHGGRIWIESDPLIGTTFYLALPHQMQEER